MSKAYTHTFGRRSMDSIPVANMPNNAQVDEAIET